MIKNTENINRRALATNDRSGPVVLVDTREVAPSIGEIPVGETLFGIRLADTDEGRAAAGALIRKMYSWRGYAGTHKIADDPNVTTISIESEGVANATVTLTVDSSAGLLADALFGDVLSQFRTNESRLCEVTKLASDNVGTKEALASLFHILYIHAVRVHHCTDIFIEVNPRHRRYYERMLGFKCLTEVRTNPRVDAPAFLLWLNLEKMSELIAQYADLKGCRTEYRSLYPFFFSKREEDGIAARILAGIDAG